MSRRELRRQREVEQARNSADTASEGLQLPGGLEPQGPEPQGPEPQGPEPDEPTTGGLTAAEILQAGGVAAAAPPPENLESFPAPPQNEQAPPQHEQAPPAPASEVASPPLRWRTDRSLIGAALPEALRQDADPAPPVRTPLGTTRTRSPGADRAADLVQPDAEDPPSGSRAGRNLPVAIGVGVGLVALLGASLFFYKELFGLLALAVAIGAVIELRQALARVNIAVPVAPILVGAVGMVVSAYLVGPEALLVAFVVTAGAVAVWCVLDSAPGGRRALRNASAAIFVTAYVPFLGAFLGIALAPSDGVWRVLLAVLIGVASDLGGYVTGVLWGRHQIAPNVSPKKSWEGLAGSVVLAAAVSTAIVMVFLDAPGWIGVLVGVLGAITALLGDLAESLIKRDLGMKDMGSLLPGHGGVLDRVDSILVVAPIVTILLSLLVPVP